MQTRIIRPDVRQPQQYQMLLSESTLMWLEGGVLEKAGRLHRDIKAHDNCDMTAEDGCEVRRAWIENQYGTLKEGLDQGCKLTDCSEDLMFLHGSLAELMDFVTQSRYIRNNMTARSYHELSDAEAQLLALKGQAAYRAEVAKEPTGLMPKLTDAKLDELDKTKADESLLGLAKTK